jgi:hypothetical protein
MKDGAMSRVRVARRWERWNGRQVSSWSLRLHRRIFRYSLYLVLATTGQLGPRERLYSLHHKLYHCGSR